MSSLLKDLWSKTNNSFIRSLYQYIYKYFFFKLHKIMTGDQPDGKMIIEVDNSLKCDGYGKGTIIIKYNMYAGERDGKHFGGTQRWAYLPNNKDGKEVA